MGNRYRLAKRISLMVNSNRTEVLENFLPYPFIDIFLDHVLQVNFFFLF